MSIKIHPSADTHRNKKNVVIQFDYSTEIVNLLKVSFPTRWSQTKKCWWIARKDFDYRKFKEVFSTIAEIIIPPQKQKDKSTEQILPADYLEKLIRVRVLSKNEIAAMINSTNNIKHKSLIALIYSCGLRRCEAINMELKDIDSNRMLIKIIAGKGKKDRYVQLAKSTLLLLREYYKKHTPCKWVFEGPNNKPYSAKSISNVIKSAAQKAGVKKRVYPHILRHSFATHHLEQGTDLRYIQEWLGHGSSKTTEICTHVSNKDFIKFKNPIDGLIEDT